MYDSLFPPLHVCESEYKKHTCTGRFLQCVSKDAFLLSWTCGSMSPLISLWFKEQKPQSLNQEPLTDFLTSFLSFVVSDARSDAY